MACLLNFSGCDDVVNGEARFAERITERHQAFEGPPVGLLLAVDRTLAMCEAWPVLHARLDAWFDNDEIRWGSVHLAFVDVNNTEAFFRTQVQHRDGSACLSVGVDLSACEGRSLPSDGIIRGIDYFEGVAPMSSALRRSEGMARLRQDAHCLLGLPDAKGGGSREVAIERAREGLEALVFSSDERFDQLRLEDDPRILLQIVDGQETPDKAAFEILLDGASMINEALAFDSEVLWADQFCESEHGPEFCYRDANALSFFMLFNTIRGQVVDTWCMAHAPKGCDPADATSCSENAECLTKHEGTSVEYYVCSDWDVLVEVDSWDGDRKHVLVEGEDYRLEFGNMGFCDSSLLTLYPSGYLFTTLSLTYDRAR